MDFSHFSRDGQRYKKFYIVSYRFVSYRSIAIHIVKKSYKISSFSPLFFSYFFQKIGLFFKIENKGCSKREKEVFLVNVHSNDRNENCIVSYRFLSYRIAIQRYNDTLWPSLVLLYHFHL